MEGPSGVCLGLMRLPQSILLGFVLPPKFSNKNLKVAEGGAAMMAYGDAVRRMGEHEEGEREGEEWGEEERELREYCKHDTRVMVEIMRVLVEKCGVGR